MTLALSDVIGDPPDGIASGPTVFSSTTDEDALVVLARRGLAERFPRAIEVLGRAGPCERALTPGAPSPYLIVGSNRLSVDAICAEATGRGFEVNAPIPPLAGEAREAGRHLGGLARQIRERGWPLGPPACVVVGGENTVHVRGNGRGGRCQELALAAALALDGCLRATLLAFATDGIDGPTDAAGAVVTGETVARARGLGLCAEAYLDDNDAWTFFRTLEDLWVTGPTGTNVNDLAILLVYP